MSLDVGWNLLVVYAHFSAQSCVLALMLTLVCFPRGNTPPTCMHRNSHTFSLCPCDSRSLGLTLWGWPTWHNFSCMPCFPSGNFSTFFSPIFLFFPSDLSSSLSFSILTSHLSSPPCCMTVHKPMPRFIKWSRECVEKHFLFLKKSLVLTSASCNVYHSFWSHELRISPFGVS